jgi:hypothetical protein
LPAGSVSGYSSEAANLTSTGFVERDEIQLDERPAHVIVMVHGMRDLGIRALDIQHYSYQNGLKIEIAPVSYGWLGVFSFLVRLRAHSIEDLVYTRINKIFDAYPDAVHSVIAHSNGTKILCRVIGRLRQRFRFVIFCGSVAKDDEGDSIIGKAENIINDCSSIDIWPILAQVINPNEFEATGTYGFRNGLIRDRFFKVSHGGCLTRKHFEEYIIPILLRNTLKLGDRPKAAIPITVPVYARICLILAALICVAGVAAMVMR